jgi:hypothetical protein
LRGRDDVAQKDVDRLVGDQQFGHLGHAAHDVFTSSCGDPRGVEDVNDSSNEQHHDHVDREGGPVLGLTDAERPIGRYEEVVVDQKSARDTRCARGKPADDGAHDDRNDEDECGRRGTDVGPEGQEHATDRKSARHTYE